MTKTYIAATTHKELDAFLGKRNSRKLCHNTYAERLGADAIGIRLHQTHVVTLTLNRLTLNTGGWDTVTTKDRINKFLPVGWSVVQKNREWFLQLHICSNGEGSIRLVNEPFYDGITLDLTFGQHGKILSSAEVL